MRAREGWIECRGNPRPNILLMLSLLLPILFHPYHLVLLLSMCYKFEMQCGSQTLLSFSAPLPLSERLTLFFTNLAFSSRRLALLLATSPLFLTSLCPAPPRSLFPPLSLHHPALLCDILYPSLMVSTHFVLVRVSTTFFPSPTPSLLPSIDPSIH